MSPTVVFHGADGAVLFRAIGYYPPARFRTVLNSMIDGRYALQSFRQYSATVSMPENLAAFEPVNATLFSNPPFMLDRSVVPAQSPLMVLFEGEGCVECRQLQSDVLSHLPVLKLLERYDVVRMSWTDAYAAGHSGGQAFESGGLGDATRRLPRTCTRVFRRDGNRSFPAGIPRLHQRMERALLYSSYQKAYTKDMTYQQFNAQKVHRENPGSTIW